MSPKALIALSGPTSTSDEAQTICAWVHPSLKTRATESHLQITHLNIDVNLDSL